MSTCSRHMDLSFSKATHMKDFKIEGQINSFALMSTNQLLVADSTNRKVLLVDTGSGRLLSELELSSPPHQVTRISDTEAAVTFPKEQRIVFFGTEQPTHQHSSRPQLSLLRQISVQGECYGIAYMDNTLIVAFWEVRVEIMDMSGNALQTISLSGNEAGKLIFTRPRYVSVDTVTRSIVVSDSGFGNIRAQVVKLSKEGRVEATYSDDGESWLHQVALDTQGMIYVVRYCRTRQSGYVDQLDANCDLVRTIISDLSLPQALGYDEATQQLYVGQDDGVIKVYKLT